MDIIELRDYLLSLPLVEECQPFGEDSVVYNIGGKMFAAYTFSRPEYLHVKCDPDRAEVLRDEFEAITPAWHFNKQHWNDLCFGSLPDKIVRREIRHSYFTVLRKNVTPRALREEILQILANRGFVDDTPPID